VAFVGRLQSDTTEEDLIDWLAEGGIHDAKCRKLIIKLRMVVHLRQQLFELSVMRNIYLCYMMNRCGQLVVSSWL